MMRDGYQPRPVKGKKIAPLPPITGTGVKPPMSHPDTLTLKPLNEKLYYESRDYLIRAQAFLAGMEYASRFDMDIRTFNALKNSKEIDRLINLLQ